MNSDDRKRPADVKFIDRGHGMFSGWVCGKCHDKQGSFLGRKMRMHRGSKVWVCTKCQAKDAS
jgi:hypothetical protein